MNSRISVRAIEVKRLMTSIASEIRESEDATGIGSSVLMLRQMSSLIDDLLDAIHGEEIQALKETILQMPEARWARLDSEWLDFLSSDYVRLKASEWLIAQSQSRGLPVLEAWKYTVETNQLIAASRGD